MAKMGVKATAETTAGFKMNTGTSKYDAQHAGPGEEAGPDMKITKAMLLKAAGSNVMAGVSAYRGKGDK